MPYPPHRWWSAPPLCRSTPSNQHVAGRYARFSVSDPALIWIVALFTQHVTCFRVPRAHAAGHLLGAESRGIGAVKGHVIQQQAIGLEGKRRRLNERFSVPSNRVMVSICSGSGELAAARDIHHFCRQDTLVTAIALEMSVFGTVELGTGSGESIGSKLSS